MSNSYFYSRMLKHLWSAKVWGWGLIGDSSGKSQKPLYSTLENYPETQDKSPNSILRLLPSCTWTKVVSRMSSKGRTFSI